MTFFLFSFSTPKCRIANFIQQMGEKLIKSIQVNTTFPPWCPHDIPSRTNYLIFNVPQYLLKRVNHSVYTVCQWEARVFFCFFGKSNICRLHWFWKSSPHSCVSSVFLPSLSALSAHNSFPSWGVTYAEKKLLYASFFLPSSSAMKLLSTCWKNMH